MPLVFTPGAKPTDPVARQLEHLQSRLTLSAVMDPLKQRGEDLGAMSLALPNLRKGGWRWYSSLEAEIARLRAAAHEQLHRAETTRQSLVAPLSGRLSAAAPRLSDPAQRPAVQRELDAIDQALVDCERQVERALSDWALACDRCLSRARLGQETLDRFADAGFRLPAGERPLLAVRASWLADLTAPPGVLLLTDQRHRFERRDDRVLRRNRAGIATETHADRTVLLDEPHSALAAARDASTGFVVKEPRVTLTWKSGAFAGQALTLKLERPEAKELVAACEALRVGNLGVFG